VTHCLAATAIAQKGAAIWRADTGTGLRPATIAIDAVARELLVPAGAEVEIGPSCVLRSYRPDDDAGAEAGEIVIPNQLRPLNVESAVAIEKKGQ